MPSVLSAPRRKGKNIIIQKSNSIYRRRRKLQRKTLKISSEFHGSMDGTGNWTSDSFNNASKGQLVVLLTTPERRKIFWDRSQFSGTSFTKVFFMSKMCSKATTTTLSALQIHGLPSSSTSFQTFSIF
jgi:hypothetical protein